MYIAQYIYKTEAQYVTVSSGRVTDVDGWRIEKFFQMCN